MCPRSELGRSWAALLLALGVLCPRGSPCGISTHIEIGHRALEFLQLQDGRVNYKELLSEHQDAYQAGTVFPDSFYPSICETGKFHDVSESTHWTPFLNASIHYIRENYPLPWDKDTEKLVAFLFGITSHMVADVSWHSLGIEQGFLRTMGAIDFHGSYSEAHPTGDFGGDVLTQSEFNHNYLSRHWYVPVKDLLEIYKQLYGRETITHNAIVDCSYLQFLELYGEVLAVSKLYPTYSRKSPFLVEQFQDYFLGGLDDMAFWSTNIYRLTGLMLENGTSGCSLPENPLFIACDGNQTSTPSSPKAQRNGFHRNVTADKPRDFGHLIKHTERGVVFSVDSWNSDSLASVYQALERNLYTVFPGSPQESPKRVSRPSASYFLSSPYARLGWAMVSADFNQDGYGDLVVGAPGYSRPGHIQVGRVYLVYGNSLGLPPVDLDLDKEAHVILEGFQPSGRFGSAVAVVDFNMDGLPDLAVGAPSVGSEKLTYKGAVYIYLGARQGRPSETPDITISCQDVYCNLGWTLLAADVSGDGAPDLVMGSPFAPGGGRQRGVVAAFHSRPDRRPDTLDVEAADWTVRGEEDYAWHGHALHSTRVDNATLLLVGSPTWKNASSLGHLFRLRDEKQSVGRVDGYFLPGCGRRFSISGDKAMGKLGTSLSSGHVMLNGTRTQVLLVGAPTNDDVSKVMFLHMTLHQGGTARMYALSPDAQPTLLSTFSGDRRFSRFGGALHLSDLDRDGLDEIIMAAPLRIADLTTGLMGGEDGRVYIYNGRRTFLGDMTGRCKAWTSPCPEEKAQYVLISPEARSRFGSSLTTVRSRDKNQVVIAAGRSSFGARLSGALHIYSLV